MDNIRIGNIIAYNRKKKNITQEELADHLCISKAAVSKWESCQSYPDITLLPLIASFFDITVDELLGYEPKMSDEDIRDIYNRLLESFSKEPFEDVIRICHEYLKKYYSCCNLQFYITSLIINHAYLADTKERVLSVLNECIQTLKRLEEDSHDIILSRKALITQATCHIMMNDPNKAIEILNSTIEFESQMNIEILLSSAYSMSGDTNKAKSIIEAYIYKNINGIFRAFPSLILSYGDDLNKIESCYKKAIELMNIFEINKNNGIIHIFMSLTTVTLLLGYGENEKALNILYDIINTLLIKDLFPITIKNGGFFDDLSSLFNNAVLDNITLKNQDIIKQSIKDSIIKNPSFEIFRENKKFDILMKRLEKV